MFQQIIDRRLAGKNKSIGNRERFLRRIFTDGEVAYCTAGHPPPLLVRSDGSMGTVGKPGSLLGLFADVSLHETSAELRKGDAITLFTDGVTELSVERPDEGESMLRSALIAAATEDAAPAEAAPPEEITYHAVEKDGQVTAIWEMQGRKHLRTIDPR